jgi:hypothetical protein
MLVWLHVEHVAFRDPTIQGHRRFLGSWVARRAPWHQSAPLADRCSDFLLNLSSSIQIWFLSGHCSSIEAFGVAMKSFEKSEEAQEDPGLLLRSSIT